jgi:DNA-directed RNA polymerase specialized sigma subunit
MSKKPKIESPWAKKDDLKQITPGGEEVSKDKLQTHYEIWNKARTPSNASPLLDQLQPDIDASLRNYGGQSSEKLRTQAELMTLNLLESYDPKKGAAIRTHVRNGLHKLTRLRNDRENVMHIPENVQAEQAHIRKVTNEFKAEYDREPNIQELADRSKFSTGQLERIRKYGGTKAESTTMSEKGDPLVGTERNAGQMWIDYVYFELDPIDKKIYEWSSGYKGSEQLSKKDIAKRLKISAPAVSKRINKIVKKLEEGQELNA